MSDPTYMTPEELEKFKNLPCETTSNAINASRDLNYKKMDACINESYKKNCEEVSREADESYKKICKEVSEIYDDEKMNTDQKQRSISDRLKKINFGDA